MSTPQCLALFWATTIVASLYVRHGLMCLNIVDVLAMFVYRIVYNYSFFSGEVSINGDDKRKNILLKVA